MNKKSILFVCTGNTCRSVLAEYLTRKYFNEKVDVFSAGLSPQHSEDAENAIYVLKSRFDVDASAHIPQGIQDYDLRQFDFVIAMDNWISNGLKKACREIPNLIVWKISDPYGDDLSEYGQCANTINKEIQKLFKDKEIF